MTRADAPPGPPPIDPRLRARRIAVRRDEGRRRRQRLVWLLATVVSVGLAWAVTVSPLLDVDRVAVAGAASTPAEQVVAAAGVDRGAALLYVDLGDVRRRVEALPWVASADASRGWPGTLRITVVERRPAAVMPARGGGWAIADGEGWLLAIEAARPPGLPVVEGAGFAGAPGEVVPATASGALEVAAAMPATLRDRIAAIAVTRGGELELRLEVGEGHEATVRFGLAEEIAEKLLALAALLERADLAGVRTIDVRVPGVPAVSRG